MQQELAEVGINEYPNMKGKKMVEIRSKDVSSMMLCNPSYAFFSFRFLNILFNGYHFYSGFV